MQKSYSNLLSYADDFGPLKAACGCYVCKNFTRAYIYHLLHTKEISGHTLLMMYDLLYVLFFTCRFVHFVLICLSLSLNIN